MTQPFTLPRLRRIARGVPGSTVHTQKDCIENGHPYDPPCAYMELRWVDGVLRLNIDGDLDVHGEDGGISVFSMQNLSNAEIQARMVGYALPQTP